jgi:hypothetical protein
MLHYSPALLFQDLVLQACTTTSSFSLLFLYNHCSPAFFLWDLLSNFGMKNGPNWLPSPQLSMSIDIPTTDLTLTFLSLCSKSWKKMLVYPDLSFKPGHKNHRLTNKWTDSPLVWCPPWLNQLWHKRLDKVAGVMPIHLGCMNRDLIKGVCVWCAGWGINWPL